MVEATRRGGWPGARGRAMKAALYVRVSTHAGQNPEMQLRELREYCARRAWEVAGKGSPPLRPRPACLDHHRSRAQGSLGGRVQCVAPFNGPEPSAAVTSIDVRGVQFHLL